MTVLQPITTKSPSSQDVLEQSGLPFSFVLRPFGNRSSLSTGNDDEFYARQLERRRQKGSKGEGDEIQTYPLKLALVAKCTHCGSPMNSSSPIVGRQTVLCNLCGKTYDIDYQTQHESRIAASASSSVTGFPSNLIKSQSKSVSMPLDRTDMDETEYRNRYSRTSTLTECVKPLMEYSLPLLSMAPLSSAPNSRRIEDSTDMEIAESIYTMPAKLCPPLLAIFIDATCPNPQYYNRICETLNQLINLNGSSESKSKSGEHTKDEYGLCKSTRIGIFCMTENGGLSIFDLTENGGHLKHVWVRKPDTDSTSSSERDYQSSGDDDYDNDEFEVAPLADIMTPEEIFAPLDSEYSKACVLSALRGLEDSSITINLACQRNHNSKERVISRKKNSSGHGHGGGVCFGSTLEYFLDFMKHVGYHPGEMNHSNHILGENKDSGTSTGSHGLEPAQKFMYAGGKIMCFLSGPPDEIGVPTIRKGLKAEIQAKQNGRIGAGGYGGSCAEVGKRFEGMKDGGSGGEGSYFSGNVEPVDVDVEFGKGLPREDISGKDGAEQPIGTRSSHKDEKIANTKYLNVTALYNDIGKYSARSAFSTEIFVLLPKLESEESDKGNLPEQYVGIPFLRLLSDRSGGAGPLVITYPLVPLTSDNEDDILANEVISRSPFNRNHAFGSMLRLRLPPSLRIDTNTNRSKASRSNNMSVNSQHNFDKYYQTNGLYGSVTASNEDSALFCIGSCDESSTLSFALNICSRSGMLDEYVYVDGRGDVRLCPCIQTCFAYTSIVKNRGQWVTVRRLRVLTLELDLTTSVESMTASLDSEALIVPLYHNFYHHALQYGLTSVEDHAVNWLLSVLFCCYESARKMQGLIDRYGPTVEGASEFYPNDRLLDIDTERSHFSKRDILLGRGHAVFECLPLLVFALVQSDALRPNCGRFKPSIDSRAAAAAQMGNMPPLTISRCIAPRLELWLTGKDSNIAANEDVNMSMNDVRYAIIDHIGASDGEEEVDYKGPMPLLLLDSPSQVLIHDCLELCNLRKISDADIPPAMINAAEDGRRSYRSAPRLNKLVSNGVEDCATVAMQHLSDVMVEDSVTSVSKETFNEWCTAIAEVLHSELSTTD